jgi:hypothetical protein
VPLTVPHAKPPIIDGRQAVPSERYNLDEPLNRKNLNISFKDYEPVADEYNHYSHCKWAVIEYKSCSLKNAIEQLENTVKQLTKAQKKVDLAIIVLKKFDGKEKDIYKRVGNNLIIRSTKTIVSIPTGNRRITVSLYDPDEINRQYAAYNGSLAKWQSM